MDKSHLDNAAHGSAKIQDMQVFRADSHGMNMTTAQGVCVTDNQNTLSAGVRGPALLEDFHFIEKLAHFGRERIPERVVHARGSGAHGYFQVYESLAAHTKAAFLQYPEAKTPVFVRFSTVQGFRGSADTVRDIRGFAVKFYTSEGNFDLVGNNTPVFFIQDAIKFPDLIHAVKPEPKNEVPQGQSAHDSFWDFVSLQPETLHNLMWHISDRGIPRSYRTMEGFGIHTYRMINAQGKACFVRFHWKPLCGTASLIWDEAQELAGRDPDFHRKDLWHAIENGHFPEFELGLQIIPEQEEHAFDFDILDATKLIPEALVPVQKIGKMVLNRNPDNFFAETEQIAFCPANIVPGIDFSDDPLLQGRLFAYTDSQRYRLGGPNFTELPINRPLVPVRNQQRDGAHRMQIDVSAANYQPNSLDGNWPCEVPSASHHGGFASFPTPTEGIKIRQRSASFADHFSQPRLFWRSQTRSEQLHIIQAFAFELGNVRHIEIRERVIDLLAHIDHGLAQAVASRLGISLTQEQRSYPLPEAVHGLEKDPSLSLYAHGKQSLKARRVAILADNGVCQQCIDTILPALQEQGIHACILAPQAGHILTTMDTRLAVDGTVGNTSSVLFDALVIPGGTESLHSLKTHTCTRRYLCQTYRHLKPIALADGAELLLAHTGIPEAMLHNDVGIIHKEDIRQTMEAFLNVLTRHRIWEREEHLVNALQA